MRISSVMLLFIDIVQIAKEKSHSGQKEVAKTYMQAFLMVWVWLWWKV